MGIDLGLGLVLETDSEKNIANFSQPVASSSLHTPYIHYWIKPIPLVTSMPSFIEIVWQLWKLDYSDCFGVCGVVAGSWDSSFIIITGPTTNFSPLAQSYPIMKMEWGHTYIHPTPTLEELYRSPHRNFKLFRGQKHSNSHYTIYRSNRQSVLIKIGKDFGPMVHTSLMLGYFHFAPREESEGDIVLFDEILSQFRNVFAEPIRILC